MNIIFALLRNTITRDYEEAQIIINLLFIIKEITNCLIYCKINKEIKKLLNYSLTKTILNIK